MLQNYIKLYFVVAIQLCLIVTVITNHGNELPSPPLCGLNPISNRIIGGNALSLDEHPWAALLDFALTFNGSVSSDYQCGGVLLNTRYVLTAAHCLAAEVQNIKRKLLVVRLGEHDLLQFPVDCEVDAKSGAQSCAAEPIDYVIEKMIVHPKYNSETKYNDIALLRLDKDVEFTDSIKPVCLPTATTSVLKTNDTLYSIGWGSTNAENVAESTSSVKRIVGLRLWSNNDCRSRLGVVTNQLCAGGEANHDACLGDSGGPLLKAVSEFWYTEGIISYGNGCGKAGWPGVYTSVRSYLPWIKQNLEP